ncbi:MAG: cadherin-like beta sandwich domain-containing protein [Nitrospira sp.]|nr:cadherin-like beta sandwich domain-containing protein [Nitrospira sp.]
MTKHILNDLAQQKVSGSTMTHPCTRTGRSLVGLALVLLGLSTYGCGDTGTSTQPAELGGLSATAGLLEPKFNSATTAYTVKLFGTESSTTITASPRVAGDTIRINNQQISSQTVTLTSINTSAELSIVVTETGAGGTSKSYSVLVSREEEDTTLKDLSSPDGTLAPSPFVKTELAPSISGVGNGVTSITLTATKSDPNTVMEIQLPTTPVTVITVPAGIPSGNATVQLGGPGSATTVPIIITGPKGGKTTYQVTIKRGASVNAFLGSLSISQGNLNFTPGRNDSPYEVSVPSGVDKVTVTGKPQDANATVQPNSQTINLLGPGQTTSITVGVTAQDGQSKQNYVIRVKQAALNGNNHLKSLVVSQGSLDTGFDPNDQQYNVSLLSSVTSVRITANPQDGTARVTINGKSSPTDIDLGAPGPRTQITTSIIVTAQNNDTRTYNVTFDRAALGGNFNLQSLTVTGQALSPTFSQSTTRYTLEVDNSVGSITVNAASQDNRASVSLLVGNVQKTNPIPLPAGPSTTEIEIEVTAQNGSPKSYFITVTRKAPSSNNNLSALKVSASSSEQALTPSFGQSPTNEYVVNVATEVTSVTVTATKADPNAVISGSLPNEGLATISLDGAPSSKTISIIVMAPDETKKTYTVILNRAAPAAKPDKPATAPDLITAEDACPLKPLSIGHETGTDDDCARPEPTVADPNPLPFGTREDNITSVTKPGFTIPQHKSEETPSLYVGTTKYTFPPGTTTLRPTVDLDEGTYAITYTLTNAGGESEPSPALSVTINKSAGQPPSGGS